MRVFLVVALGAAAALLMLLAEATNLFSIEVESATCKDLADPELADGCEVTGGEQHSWALVPVALLTAVMAVGAGIGRSRPAAAALVLAGLLVLGIALLGDIPDTNDTGQVGRDFEDARVVKENGLWFELAGGILALLAGLLRFFPARPGRPRA